MIVERLSELVRMVRAPNPSPLTLDGTNTYLVGARDPIVIDPGPAIESHLDAVLEEAGTVSLVLLTHSHPDHAEGAERFAAMARAPLAAHAERDGAAALTDGQRINEAGVSLRAIHTPGHASDHLSFLLEEERALFTGDHVLGRGTTVIAYPDGDLRDYLGSLERVIALAPGRLYPGHGPVVEEPGPVLAYYKEHRLEREQQVLAAVGGGEDTVERMVKRIYAAYDVALHGAAALSVRAHLEKLRSDGAVEQEGDRWRRSP